MKLFLKILIQKNDRNSYSIKNTYWSRLHMEVMNHRMCDETTAKSRNTY